MGHFDNYVFILLNICDKNNPTESPCPKTSGFIIICLHDQSGKRPQGWMVLHVKIGSV